MKTTMIYILTLLSGSAFADLHPIKNEEWTCLSDKRKLIVTVDSSKANGTVLFDGAFEEVKLSSTSGRDDGSLLTELTGSTGPGHDWEDYTVILVRQNEQDDFEDYGGVTETKDASAVMVVNAYYDCLGNRAFSAKFDCSVTFVRE